eukprot:XP_001694490.1 flagellar associated protein [Chlamydomonas reinhardtii]
MSAEAAWLSEAIVEFLKARRSAHVVAEGPMYINPLMGFIDEKCLIFTPEEENKFEYTIYHNEFKELVDGLLTEFLEDLGVVAKAQGSDQLTSFVVQPAYHQALRRTILTVDDFLMFKAMMVRRNIDLTNQVLEAVEEARRLEAKAAAASKPEASGGSLTAKAAATAAEEDALKEAMALSNKLAAEWDETDRLHKAMRALQLEDEDVAFPAAIAASLREQAKYDSELADIEQAGVGEWGRRSHPVIARAAPQAPSLAPLKANLVKSSSVRNRGAGYKTEAAGVDLEAIRKAAQQAAESQKKLVGKGDVNDAATKWLQEAKLKLIAQKQAEREREMVDYKAASAGKPKPSGPSTTAAAADDAKRAALREALAQKMKQNIMGAN